MVNSSYCNELFNSYEQRYIWLSPVLQWNSGIAAKRPCQEYKEYSIDSWFWYQTVKKALLQWSHRIQYHSRPSIEVHHIPRANVQRGKDCSRPENISLWWVNVAEMSEPSLEERKKIAPKSLDAEHFGSPNLVRQVLSPLLLGPATLRICNHTHIASRHSHKCSIAIDLVRPRAAKQDRLHWCHMKITGNGAANFDELVCLIGISGFSC